MKQPIIGKEKQSTIRKAIRIKQRKQKREKERERREEVSSKLGQVLSTPKLLQISITDHG